MTKFSYLHYLNYKCNNLIATDFYCPNIIMICFRRSFINVFLYFQVRNENNLINNTNAAVMNNFSYLHYLKKKM